MRLGKLKALRVTLLGEPVHYRTSRISKPHHLGAFVERLSYGIIYGLAENLKMQRVVHPHNLRIASTHKQAQIRE